MIRSTPPASSHLAERPVPAPAPMIGRPEASVSRSRRSASSRVMIRTIGEGRRRWTRSRVSAFPFGYCVPRGAVPMAYEIKMLDLIDIELESSFLVLARNMGIRTRVKTWGYLILGSDTEPIL